MIRKPGSALFLLLMFAVLASCIPAAATDQPAQQLPTASEITATYTLTLTDTSTSTSTVSPTTSQTPSLTPSLMPGVTVIPTRTRPTNRKGTETPAKLPSSTQTMTVTLEPTDTGTAPATVTRCPVPTPEIFYVEPLISPTNQLSQVITVRIGNGEEVTVVTESGTFTDTTSPFLVEITLLPDTVHHLQVWARVRQVWVNGCMYGGYTMTTTFDRNRAPLTIVQRATYP